MERRESMLVELEALAVVMQIAIVKLLTLKQENQAIALDARKNA